MSSELQNKKCLPCETGAGSLDKLQIVTYMKEVPDWTITADEKKIEKTFEFLNFAEALDFINRVGEIAEDEGHHPDILLFNWNKVKISLTTHAALGLTENDFILATKTDSTHRLISEK